MIGALILVGSLWVGALLASQIRDRDAPIAARLYSAKAG